MQTLFTVLWGMAEAVVDTAALMQGKHVPLVKTADQFCVDFPELFGFTHDLVMKKVSQYKQQGKTSFGYEEYLCFFLLGMEQSTICLRMLDLMEWKIQKKLIKGKIRDVIQKNISQVILLLSHCLMNLIRLIFSAF